MSKEAMKQWADDVSKAYDILAFGNTERAAEILGKTRDAIRKALAEQHLQDLHDENVRLGLYEQGEPVAQWQKRHLLRTDGKWKNTNEHDAKWWRLGHAQGWEIRTLYTTPQQRTWVGLTDEEIQDAGRFSYCRGGTSEKLYHIMWNSQPSACIGWSREELIAFTKAVEAKYQEKNNG